VGKGTRGGWKIERGKGQIQMDSDRGKYGAACMSIYRSTV
jgi:hypothetical protein